MSKAWRRKLRKTLYFQYFKFQKGQNSRKNWQEFMTLKLDRIFIRRNWHAKFQLNMSKHVGEKCGKLTDRRRPGWRPGRTDRRTSPYHNTRRLKTVFNKSPKGHWSLTWVQWALLLKVRFLSKWLITQKAWLPILFLKSVRKQTIAIFQFRIRRCIQFVAVAFISEEEVFWRRGPSLTYFALPWIHLWADLAEKPKPMCKAMITSSLPSLVNIH